MQIRWWTFRWHKGSYQKTKISFTTWEFPQLRPFTTLVLLARGDLYTCALMVTSEAVPLTLVTLLVPEVMYTIITWGIAFSIPMMVVDFTMVQVGGITCPSSMRVVPGIIPSSELTLNFQKCSSRWPPPWQPLALLYCWCS